MQQYQPSSFQILPPVVKNLLIINGILYLATVVLESKFGFDLTHFLGLHFPTSEYFNVFQFVSHLFMHGSFLHLFSNMFALWMFGNMLENVWGSRRFFIYYMITGLGAALVHLLAMSYEISQMREAVELYASQANFVDFKMLVDQYSGYITRGDLDYFNTIYMNFGADPANPAAIQQSIEAAWELLKNKTNVPTVGASGAVFGVLLAFGMLFPNMVIYLYFAIPVKAKYFVALYGIFELYSGFQNSPGDNVAHFAHLGGMLFGFILIRIWNRNRRNRFY